MGSSLAAVLSLVKIELACMTPNTNRAESRYSGPIRIMSTYCIDQYSSLGLITII